jgi:hypothetical protein
MTSDSSLAGAAPEEVLRALADPERLAVAGALALRDRTAGELAEDLGVPLARIRRHLAKLTGAGIAAVQSDRRTYRLVAELLRQAARQIAPPRESGLPVGVLSDDEVAILARYFRGGRLRDMPAKRSHRQVVLARLSVEFEVGRRYSESEVNEVLTRFHADYASLRRYLVDEAFLSREQGEYWRSGGPVDV